MNAKDVDTLDLLISTWRGVLASLMGEAKLKVLKSIRIAGVNGHATAQIRGIKKRLVSVLDNE